MYLNEFVHRLARDRARVTWWAPKPKCDPSIKQLQSWLINYEEISEDPEACRFWSSRCEFREAIESVCLSRSRWWSRDIDYAFLQRALRRLHVLHSFKLKHPQKSAAGYIKFLSRVVYIAWIYNVRCIFAKYPVYTRYRHYAHLCLHRTVCTYRD